MSRLSWLEYGMQLAKTASLRSEDPYVQVGCCILRPDNSIASLGYNGAPPGVDIDWSDRDDRRKRVIHAATNALSADSSAASTAVSNLPRHTRPLEACG